MEAKLEARKTGGAVGRQNRVRSNKTAPGRNIIEHAESYLRRCRKDYKDSIF